MRFSEVKVDLGGNNVVTAVYYPDLCEDAFPFEGDYAFVESSAGRGNWVATGFLDPKLAPLAQNAGERVVFSRSAQGVVAAKLHLKTDGTIVVNDGAVVIGADGSITTEGSITAQGDVTANGEVTAKADTVPIPLSTHVHPTGVGPSGPPQAGP